MFTWSRSLMWAQARYSVVTVELAAVEGGTEVVVTQGPFDGEDGASPYVSGWEGGLDKLVRRFEEERRCRTLSTR